MTLTTFWMEIDSGELIFSFDLFHIVTFSSACKSLNWYRIIGAEENLGGGWAGGGGFAPRPSRGSTLVYF